MDKRSGELFSYVDLEQRVRVDHPLRAIRGVVSEALEALSGEFSALYSGDHEARTYRQMRSPMTSKTTIGYRGRTKK